MLSSTEVFHLPAVVSSRTHGPDPCGDRGGPRDLLALAVQQRLQTFVHHAIERQPLAPGADRVARAHLTLDLVSFTFCAFTTDVSPGMIAGPARLCNR